MVGAAIGYNHTDGHSYCLRFNRFVFVFTLINTSQFVDASICFQSPEMVALDINNFLQFYHCFVGRGFDNLLTPSFQKSHLHIFPISSKKKQKNCQERICLNIKYTTSSLLEIFLYTMPINFHPLDIIHMSMIWSQFALGNTANQ